MNELTRRDFVRGGLTAGIGIGLAPELLRSAVAQQAPARAAVADPYALVDPELLAAVKQFPFPMQDFTSEMLTAVVLVPREDLDEKGSAEFLKTVDSEAALAFGASANVTLFPSAWRDELPRAPAWNESGLRVASLTISRCSKCCRRRGRALSQWNAPPATGRPGVICP